MQLLVRISDELGFELRLPELVEHTTVARLARHLDPSSSGGSDGAPEAAEDRPPTRGSVRSAAAALALAALPPALQSTARALLLLPQLLPGKGPRPLEWLADEPRVERVTVDTPAGHEAADLFLPARPGRYPGAVMFIGAGVLGRADPRGVHLSMSLARLGIATLCYASSRMQQVHPGDIDCLVAVFRHLQGLREVDSAACGFFGVCLGAAYSLRAAAEPEIAGDVAFVAALAPYFSLRDVIQAVFSKRPVGAAPGRHWEVFPYSYPWWLGMLLRGLSPAEQQAVKTALREGLPEPAGLSEGAHAVFRLGTQPTEKEAAEFVATLPAELLARFDHNSPALYTDGLRCPVVLMHSTNDVELPFEESRKLAAALEGVTPLRYTEFTMFKHVDLRRPGRTTDYARELWKLARHIRAFTALARSRR